ncbi:zf-HC2 domain-containing protein [bacterium]|nr:zf-HC2 domain-containing protein [bacterium]
MTAPCSEMAALLAARKLGLLEPSDLAELEGHLAGCSSCREVEGDLELAFAGAELSPARAPDGIRAKLAARIQEERKNAVAPVSILLSCTYCHDALSRENDARSAAGGTSGVVFCASCLAPCHEDCFLEHGKCSTFGCDETRFVQPRNVLIAADAPRGRPSLPSKTAFRGRNRIRRFVPLALGVLGIGGLVAAAAFHAKTLSDEARERERDTAERALAQTREAQERVIYEERARQKAAADELARHDDEARARLEEEDKLARELDLARREKERVDADAARRKAEELAKRTEIDELKARLAQTEDRFNELARKKDIDQKRLLDELDRARRQAEQDRASLVGSLEGTVLLKGKPLANAEIHYMAKALWQVDEGGRGHWGSTSGSTVTTDASGHYLLSDLRPGECAFDFWQGDEAGLRVGKCLAGVMIVTGKTAKQDFELGPGTVVRGGISVPPGADATLARLSLLGAVKNACDTSAILLGDLTRADGRPRGVYCLQMFGSPPGQGKQLLTARLPGYATVVADVTLDGGQPSLKGPDLELGKGFTITGRLLRRDGTPAAKTAFWLQLVERSFSEGLVTDEQGRFQVRGLAPGKKYRILVNDGPHVAEFLCSDDTALGDLPSGD